MFENVDGRQTDGKGLTAAAGPLVYYKLTDQPFAQVSLNVEKGKFRFFRGGG